MKPVAYVNSMCNDYIDWKADPISIDGQPLYTHPVKELTDDPLANFKPVWQEVPAIKELTDEEIVNLYKETEADNGGIREFARAILRKALEK
jgi:hypothetical protein